MMKRLLLLFAFMLSSFLLMAQGQNTFRREFSIGASVGANLAYVNFVPNVTHGLLLGHNAGITLRWLTEKHLGLQMEINHVQQGWKEDFPDYPGEGYVYERKINYVEIPFLTHIYFGSDRARFTINLGPKIGYYLNESTNSNLNGAEINRVNAQHDMSVEKKLDWGLCGGPGFELHTGVGSFLLEGRYYFALGNIYGNSKADNFAMSSNQVITIKLTYLIPLIK